MNPTQKELIELVTLLRHYGTRLLDGLTHEQLFWVPQNTQGRSIINYFAHILEAEIYWLRHLGDNTYDYLKEDATFEDGQKLYYQIRDHLLRKIQSAQQSDLILQRPKFEDEKIIQKGTLGWMIWRTSMHAIHHFAQIASIRFTLGNPPKDDPKYGWSKVMDTVVALAHGIIEP